MMYVVVLTSNDYLVQITLLRCKRTQTKSILENLIQGIVMGYGSMFDKSGEIWRCFFIYVEMIL